METRVSRLTKEVIVGDERPAVPKDPQGKILKRELRKQYWGELERKIWGIVDDLTISGEFHRIPSKI